MNCHFVVGQKVVCVSPSPHPREMQDLLKAYGQVGPSLDQVLTIRAIYVGTVLGERMPCLMFEEIKNPPMHYSDGWREGGFAHFRFRPVVERKTDISIFKAMLNPTRSAVPA